MSALGPSSLGEACRTIYVRAAEDYILPPLIRDAADPDPPQRTIEVAGEDFCLLFKVCYDAAPHAAAGRFERPPLRFEIEASVGSGAFPVELAEAERFELIRAFMLGVREPIVVEGPSESAEWRLAIKLASRFVMWAPQAEPLDVGLSTDEICERLAWRLMEGAEGLFATHWAGVDVWKTRLREDLFGEPRLGADDLWPEEDAPVETFEAPALAALPVASRRRLPSVSVPMRVAARPRPRRRAVAAAMALIGLAALAGALASRGGRGDAVVTPEAVRTSDGGAAAVVKARMAAEAQSSPRLQVASLDDRVFWSPDATDARFTALAPTVTRATLALTAPSIAPPAPPRRPAVAPADAPERGAQPAKASPALATRRAGAPQARPPSPLARVDRTVKKLVKSLGALRLSRIKLSALNSPHAAGPRRP